MTFGQIKSIIENNLVQSYNNEKEFKKLLREFKYYVLNDKPLSKLYALYDQLSTPQNLTEEEAKDYLNEGISLIQKVVSGIKLPKTNGVVSNQYKNIDALVYSSSINIKERVEAKKSLIKTLMSENKKSSTSVALPIETMVKIANSTLNQYVGNLDENSKKEFLSLISENTDVLETVFVEKKEEALSKLNKILKNESDIQTKEKITETITKIENSTFDHLNLLKIKNLVESL
jgi:hypothetical protein